MPPNSPLGGASITLGSAREVGEVKGSERQSSAAVITLLCSAQWDRTYIISQQSRGEDKKTLGRGRTGPDTSENTHTHASCLSRTTDKTDKIQRYKQTLNTTNTTNICEAWSVCFEAVEVIIPILILSTSPWVPDPTTYSSAFYCISSFLSSLKLYVSFRRAKYTSAKWHFWQPSWAATAQENSCCCSSPPNPSSLGHLKALFVVSFQTCWVLALWDGGWPVLQSHIIDKISHQYLTSWEWDS